MAGAQIISPKVLTEIEERFRRAWTGETSTPFIVDAPITADTRSQAETIVRRMGLSVLFVRCPILAVWSVLTPLSRKYGEETRDVYLHVSQFTGERLEDQPDREQLKIQYRKAARKIGLPVSGNTPTELFFVPLGPPRSRHDDLARAFITTVLRLGPPAIEDTPSAREWQRQAVRSSCSNIPRLCKTIEFDRSAYCARRFEAWRKGASPLNQQEESLVRCLRARGTKFRSTENGPDGSAQGILGG